MPYGPQFPQLERLHEVKASLEAAIRAEQARHSWQELAKGGRRADAAWSMHMNPENGHRIPIGVCSNIVAKWIEENVG